MFNAVYHQQYIQYTIITLSLLLVYSHNQLYIIQYIVAQTLDFLDYI